MTAAIYPKGTAQSGFFDGDGKKKSGYHIVEPLVCTCTKELYGCFELYMELVNPPEAVRRLLSCYSYIVAPVKGRWDGNGVTRKDQLFYIENIEKSSDSSGAVWYRIYASHIFYILSTEPPYTYNQTEQVYEGNEVLFKYTRHSKYTFSVGPQSLVGSFKPMAGASSTGIIMDSGGILETFGVELHRDNFYLSASYKKEFAAGSAEAPAFRFMQGKEIESIVETAGYEGVITRLRVVDAEGNYRGIELSVPYESLGLPFEILGWYQARGETENEQRAEALKHFAGVNHPQLSYTLTMTSVEQSRAYYDIGGIQSCDIGDVGIVYSSALGTNVLQKVSRTVEDVLRGRYTEVGLGNVRNSLTRVYNPSASLGLQSGSQSATKNGGGFTATVTVSGAYNNVHVGALALSDETSIACNAVVSFGDTCEAVMSYYPNQQTNHTYAYDGQYTLRYDDCYDSDGQVMGGALSAAGLFSPNANVDNVVFYDTTKRIGQYRMKKANGEYGTTVSVLTSCPSVTTVTIPKSVEYIAANAFTGCSNLSRIIYSGTVAEWEALSDRSLLKDKAHNSALDGWYGVSDITVYCTDGTTTQHGTA